MTDRLRRFALMLAAVALLAGCATAPKAPKIVSVESIRTFEIAGRVAVNVENKGYSARMRWQHDPHADAVWLYSPVGSVLAALSVGGEGATLQTADHKAYRSSDVEALTRDVLGWELPLEGLQYWVLGRPAPDEAISELTRMPDSRIKRLQQHGWAIDYLKYFDESPLPESMALRYGDLKLRLVIDRWKLPENSR